MMQSHLGDSVPASVVIPAIVFYINSPAATSRRDQLLPALQQGELLQPVQWPAVQGGPNLLKTHTQYFQRGVEAHLFPRRCQRPKRAHNCSLVNISGWGMVGNYLSHLTLLEHIQHRYSQAPAESLLLVQDDVRLVPSWRSVLQSALAQADPNWDRLLLSWFGALRAEDCTLTWCRVNPPAGPDAEGRRYYHGLQAQLLRPRGVTCILRCLERVPIKSIDALLVNCGCPQTWALRSARSIGAHMGGSERVALDAKLKRKDSGPL
jgi:hypothetical protein